MSVQSMIGKCYQCRKPIPDGGIFYKHPEFGIVCENCPAFKHGGIEPVLESIEIKPDGNVHTIPENGPEHFETEHCWCGPELIQTYEGGLKAYLHQESQ